MDGRYVDGYALEVSYKPAIPVHRQPHHSAPEPFSYPPGPQSPPQPIWSGQAVPYVARPLQPISVPEPASNFTMWHGYPSAVREVVPPVQVIPQVTQPPVPVAPTEPSPPPPYSALPPIPEGSPESSSNTSSPARAPAIDTIPPKTPYDPCNLFIKNLDDEVIATERDLETFFLPYGTITSAFLATYAPKDDSSPPVSKGFGFIAFSRPQEAEFARERVHGTIIGRKKVFVSYAEKKEDRQMRLKILFANVEKLAQDIEQKGNLADAQTVEAMRAEGISGRGIIRPRVIEENGNVGSLGGPSPISPRLSLLITLIDRDCDTKRFIS